MIIERSMHEQFLSNTYLVGDEPGGVGILIDAGGPVAPLLDAIDNHRLELGHVLLTHHHYDHVCELDQVLERHPGAEVLIHPLERDLVERTTGTLEPGNRLQAGGLEIELLHTPGHTAGMVSPLVKAPKQDADAGGPAVFTGDTLFKGSVGGVRAPGHTTFADLRASIMDTLMKLPPETSVRPGHSDPTTIGDEWEANAFLRVWRGLDSEGDEPCTALDQPARLVLLGDDYDGGHKAWVRWEDGSDDIVPGSQIQRRAG